MKFKLFITILFFNICFFSFGEVSFNSSEYQDFSSERSTWFFKIMENNKKIFSDFYPPFDPSVKVENFDPLMEYELESNYYFNNQNNLMIEIEDLKKIYSPYFSYTIKDDQLFIEFRRYDKKIIGNLGKRNTTLEYTKRIWKLSLNLNNNSGTLKYLEFEKFIGGRNKKFIEPSNIIVEQDINLSSTDIELEKINNKIYISLSKLANYFDIKVTLENGYLAVQFNNISRITQANERVPSAKNTWIPGKMENTIASYTWANYMDDIIQNKRKTGWFWKGIYISETDNFKDTDGDKITLNINRVIPLAFYIPKNYSPNTTRLVFILHGGTGNENASAYRLSQRSIFLESYAEKYNYILAFPNGWTQNPLWMHRQALTSFEKSYDFILNNYSIDKNKVFLMGNSLGGRGTFDVAMRKPELFQAIVATAPAWGVKTHSQWKQNRYSIKDIENLPTLIGVGTADSTFSFKVEVGNNTNKGWITKDILPFLKNATYVTVEEGNHTYNWGSILDIIFDFFESKLSNKKNDITLPNQPSLIGKNILGTLMISLDDFQKIFADKFRVYKIFSYDKDYSKAVEYYTIVSKNATLNFKVGDKKYRKNIERYKEDIGKRDKDIDFLENAPSFSQAPTLIDNQVYIPIKEILSILN